MFSNDVTVSMIYLYLMEFSPKYSYSNKTIPCVYLDTDNSALGRGSLGNLVLNLCI